MAEFLDRPSIELTGNVTLDDFSDQSEDSHAGIFEVTDEGIEKLVTFTRILPDLAHEIGEAIWRTARTEKTMDNQITEEVIFRGSDWK